MSGAVFCPTQKKRISFGKYPNNVILLVNRGDDSSSIFHRAEGVHEGACTYTNIKYMGVRDVELETNRYRWALAHELAHAFWNGLSDIALEGCCHIQDTDGKSFDDSMVDLISDSDPMTERYADAIAIAWGFGKELVSRLHQAGALCIDSSCINSGDYLDSDILGMLQYAAEKEYQRITPKVGDTEG